MIMEKYKSQIVQSTKDLVAIPSIIGQKEVFKPFGAAIDQCLETTIALCSSLGMSVYKDPNGYYGYAEIGTGKDYIGILCHLDVVPTGDITKWKTEPFHPVEKEGVIYGRGTGDDKGPTVSAIYAVKALLDSEVPLQKRVRLIFGTDEETLWRGMAKYKKEQPTPLYAFAADGYFPFTYAEKGLLQMDIIAAIQSNEILFSGGENYNSVAATASYSGPLAQQLYSTCDQQIIDVTLDNDALHIIGVSSHAASPHIGKNAVLYLALLLQEIGISSKTVQLLTEVFHFDYAKTNLFLEPIEDHTGPVSVNIGAVQMDQQVRIKLDIRYPVTYQKERLIQAIKDRVEPYGFTATEHSYLPPLYVPLDSPFTKILLDTYQEYSGDYESTPRINGGATYARAYPDRAVCFGVKQKGRPSYAHEPNEQIDVKVLVDGAEIYYQTLKKLVQL